MRKHETSKASRNKKDKEKPVVIIGKKGPTDFSISEISKTFNRSKLVKVKILKTALVNADKKDIAHRVADATDSKMVEMRGHTFVLFKSKKNRKGIYNTPLKYSKER